MKSVLLFPFILRQRTQLSLLLLLLFSIGEMGCSEKRESKCINVTATAYNDVYWQTKSGTPSIAAWGDTLKKGMKAIAVSRDLIDSGLIHNMAVYIPLLQDTFYVKDKMHYRWRKKIDIFMGKDIKKARKWGKQQVSILFYFIQYQRKLWLKMNEINSIISKRKGSNDL